MTSTTLNASENGSGDTRNGQQVSSLRMPSIDGILRRVTSLQPIERRQSPESDSNLLLSSPEVNAGGEDRAGSGSSLTDSPPSSSPPPELTDEQRVVLDAAREWGELSQIDASTLLQAVFEKGVDDERLIVAANELAALGLVSIRFCEVEQDYFLRVLEPSGIEAGGSQLVAHAKATRNMTSRAFVLSVSSTPPGSEKPTQSTVFRMSDFLREAGEELTELEAAILDVAQTINQRFKHGRPVVFRQLSRVLRRYHGNIVAGQNPRNAAQRLVGRGLCSLDSQTICLTRHCDRSGKRSSSRYTHLASSEAQELLLLACHHCVGVGFDNRNVASRAAVKALMHARHRVTNKQINKIIHELIESGVIEIHRKKGEDALRLTEEAACGRNKE